MYKKALEEAEILNDAHLPVSLDDLGRLYQSEDKLSQAETLFKRSLKFRQAANLLKIFS